ncbi:MAG TPA: GNAT family N-acetyltransferase [Acidimicrobiales bacterium]|nr:GNAT family N-acetyltransferase [Acidimicrobiales bacterium]
MTETSTETRPQGVRIEPARLDWAEALSEGDDVFGDRFGIPVEPGWAGFPDALPILLDAVRGGVDPQWGPLLFFDSDGALVGNGGWKGPPSDGVAEIGYAVSPSRQRRGIATEVVRRLLGQAWDAKVRAVVAHTLAEENASTRVLTRCGFCRTAELIDPDEGPIWRWEVRLQSGVRVADPSEWDYLREIEDAADQMFAEVGIGPFNVVEEDDHLSQAAVVLVSGDPPTGFACVDVVDGGAHLWQLSVHPSWGRRGIGRRLVEAVCDWASANGYPAVTLTTFRDVPWNAPFYSSLGFRVLEDLPPGLKAIRDHERDLGDDDFGPRVAMRKDVG